MKKLLFLLPFLLLPSLHAGSFTSETLSSTPVQVKTGATNVNGILIINPNAVPIYVHTYDALSGSVTVGTTTQTGAPWPVAANGYLWLAPNGRTQGQYYATGLTIAATTTATSTGSTAPGSGLVISLAYN